MIDLDNLQLKFQLTAAALSDRDNQILLNSVSIGLAQYKVLAVLVKKENVTQKEIAVTLDQTEASVSRQLSSMFDDGLVKSEPKKGDRRVHLINLTPRGKRIAKKAAFVLAKANKEMFKKLSRQQQNHLAGILEKLK